MTRLHPAPRPRLFPITWPIFSEHLLYASVGLLFIGMTARISDDTAAAFGLSNQIMAFFVILFRLVGVGASVVITQYLGAGDREGAQRIARASLACALWLGIASALIVALGADGLLTLMKTPDALRPAAEPYLVILGLSLTLESIVSAMSAVLRAYTRTRDALGLMISMHFASIVLGLPAMNGWFGLPKLGLIGIGLGFLGARVIVLGLHCWLWRKHLGIVPHLGDWWRIPQRQFKEMMHIGLPGAGENVAYRVSFTVVLTLVAGMGTGALALHTYMLQVTYFILLTGLALGFGTEIVVGHYIGAGQLHDADRVMRKALRWGLLSSVALAAVTVVFSRTIVGVFTENPALVDHGTHLMWVVLLLEPGRTFNLVVINALRATGDVRFPVLAGACSMFGVGAGLAWLLGVHMGYGLLGIWLAFAADEWLRGLVMVVRWRRHHWVRHAQSTRRRILAHQQVLTEPVEAI